MDSPKERVGRHRWLCFGAATVSTTAGPLLPVGTRLARPVRGGEGIEVALVPDEVPAVGVVDHGLPYGIPNKHVAVADDPEGELGPGDGHVHPAIVPEESQGGGISIELGGANAGENDDIHLGSLESVDGGDGKGHVGESVGEAVVEIGDHDSKEGNLTGVKGGDADGNGSGFPVDDAFGKVKEHVLDESNLGIVAEAAGFVSVHDASRGVPDAIRGELRRGVPRGRAAAEEGLAGQEASFVKVLGGEFLDFGVHAVLVAEHVRGPSVF